MLINKDNLSWKDIISFDATGIKLADYNTLYNFIVKQFRSIYGQDIDLTTGSADNIFLNTWTLFLNNILQTVKAFYSSLDAKTAVGVYLDRICALNNVIRKKATSSTCRIGIELSDTEINNYTTNEIQLKDINGNIWIAKNINGWIFKPGETKSILFTCYKTGPISAPIGSINQLVSNEVTLIIHQDEDALLGRDKESDYELRSRRFHSLGSSGNTVMGNLTSALLDIEGVEDCKVYNNNTGTDMTAKDGTTILNHDIYVVVKKTSSSGDLSNYIGTTIFEKNTPGINTTKFVGSNGESKSFNYSTVIGEDFKPVQMVYWKEASYVHPPISITINVYPTFYQDADNTSAKKIGNAVKDWINNLLLSEDVNSFDIRKVIDSVDLGFRGNKSYIVKDITIDGKDSYTNPDSYYLYSEDISVSSIDEDNNVTITIS